jgi:hypothetical protein
MSKTASLPLRKTVSGRRTRPVVPMISLVFLPPTSRIDAVATHILLESYETAARRSRYLPVGLETRWLGRSVHHKGLTDGLCHCLQAEKVSLSIISDIKSLRNRIGTGTELMALVGFI